MSLDPAELVTSSPRLSSLPVIFTRINEVTNDPYSSFEDVADVIMHDTSLSARLLKIVNSSFYNFSSGIDTISHAISVVGTEQLRDLALATTMLTTFKGIPETFVSMNSFWRHSVACGIAARVTSIHCKDEISSEQFFLMGILHDVGRLIIFENQPEISESLFEHAKKMQSPLFEIERNFLGTDHAAVGAALLSAWNLPASLVETVANHHDPLKALNYPLETSILCLADILAKALECGTSGDAYVPPLPPEAWDKIGISTSQLPSIWSKVDQQYADLIEIFLFG